MTKRELLEANPAMDFSNSTSISHGEAIPVPEALVKVLKFGRFKSDHDLENQTMCIGFNAINLLKWLENHLDQMDELKIFLSLDEAEKITVVLWPYKEKQPAVVSPNTEDDDEVALDPYNIGNRQPMF
jgi:hypothetical protein